MNFTTSAAAFISGFALAGTFAGQLSAAQASDDSTAQTTLSLLSPSSDPGIIEQIEALEAQWPIRDPELAKSDAEYAAVFAAQENLCTLTKIKLIGDLWRSEPGHPNLAELLPYRWENSRRIRGLDIESEVAEFARAHPDAVETIRDGWYNVARAGVLGAMSKPEAALEFANSYAARYPDDDRCAYLFHTAVRSSPDEGLKQSVSDRIAQDWPNSSQGQQLVAERSRTNRSASRLNCRSRTGSMVRRSAWKICAARWW